MNVEQRKVWNERHKVLTEIISKPHEHERAVQLFLSQHAVLYSSHMAHLDGNTCEDELMKGLEEGTSRTKSKNRPSHHSDNKLTTRNVF